MTKDAAGWNIVVTYLLGRWTMSVPKRRSVAKSEWAAGQGRRDQAASRRYDKHD